MRMFPTSVEVLNGQCFWKCTSGCFVPNASLARWWSSIISRLCVNMFGFVGVNLHGNSVALDISIGVMHALFVSYWRLLKLCTALAIFGAESWKLSDRASVSALVTMTLAINFKVWLRALGIAASVGNVTGRGFRLGIDHALSWDPLAVDYMRFARSSRGNL